ARSARVVMILHQPSKVNNIAWHPDGVHLAAACQDGKIRIWDTKARPPRSVALETHESYAWSVAYSPRGDLLASAGSERMLRLWHAHSHQPLVSTEARFASFRFSSDGTRFGCALKGTKLGLWEIGGGDQFRVFLDDSSNDSGPWQADF